MSSLLQWGRPTPLTRQVGMNTFYYDPTSHPIETTGVGIFISLHGPFPLEGHQGPPAHSTHKNVLCD